MATIAELEALIKEMKETERRESEVRRNSVKPIYNFTFLLVESEKSYHWDRIRKGTGVVKFDLHGSITNKAEIEAVGGRTDHEGGMAYLVNMTDTSNPRIVMPHGGGRIFFGGFGYSNNDHEIAESVYLKLEAFLRNNPNGGDVTHIIPEQK